MKFTLIRILLSTLLIILFSFQMFSQDDDFEDAPVIKTEKFSTKGLYLSGGLMATEIVTFHQDTTDYIDEQNSYFFQSQYEFKHNIAINVVYTKSPIYHAYIGQSIKLSTYELNGHFPCYRSYKKRGIYIESGFSYKTIGDHTLTINQFQTEFIPQASFINVLNAIGFEYKFKWIQLAATTRLNIPFGKTFKDYYHYFGPGSVDWVILLRIKLPNIHKKLNDRYHWI